MSVDKIILWGMAIFALLGALDRIFGSRFGLGKQFEEGILAIGALSLSMLGILSLAPVLARLLKPVLVPVYGFLGADPAMFAGTILANDMGGAPLAAELALTEEAGQFGGLIVGAMLGATVVFTIPVALGILEEADRPALAKGVLAGVVLGIGRAIGETMAVMMVAGNQPRITGNLLKGIRTLTTNIVLEMGYATDLHREVLIATALVLFVFILLLNLSFSALKRRSESV